MNSLERAGGSIALMSLVLAVGCGTVDDGVAAAVRGLEARLPSMVSVPRDVAEAAFMGCEGLVSRGDLVLAVEQSRDEAAVWHGTDVVCLDALEPLAREALRIAGDRGAERGTLPLDLLLQDADGELYTASWTLDRDGATPETTSSDSGGGGRTGGDPFPQPSDPDPNAGDPFPQPSDPDPNGGDPFPQPSDVGGDTGGDGDRVQDSQSPSGRTRGGGDAAQGGVTQRQGQPDVGDGSLASDDGSAWSR